MTVPQPSRNYSLGESFLELSQNGIKSNLLGDTQSNFQGKYVTLLKSSHQIDIVVPTYNPST